MARKKEKVSFFEKEIITDSTQAQAIIDKETNKFKFSLVCTAVSAVATCLALLSFTPMAQWPIFSWMEGLVYLTCFIGGIAALLTGPASIFRAMIKFGKIAWIACPMFIVDMVAFLCGILFAGIILFSFPAVFAGYNLYQSYLNKKNAETFLGLVVSTVATEETYKEESQTSVNQQPQIYSCPNCKGAVIYGEPRCKNCGTAFDWEKVV